MADNYFLRPVDFYQRELNPIRAYVKQQSFYLHRLTNQPLEVCQDYITNKIKKREFEGMRDPVVKYYERGDNGDKEITYIRLSGYISAVEKNREVFAPSGTCYVSADEKESPFVGYIGSEKKKRSIAKKDEQAAEQKGDKMRQVMSGNRQKTTKLKINSISGSFVTESCCLVNPTGHSTLTSITRTEASIGNASNEKLLAGNRHYFNANVILNNMISITTMFSRTELKDVMDRYGLYYPTVQDVLDCITYSSNLYFKDDIAFLPIIEFANALLPIERAAFVYIGDLYHLRKHNPEMVREFVTRLGTRVYGMTFEEPVKELRKIDEQIVNYAHQVCISEMKGKGKDYEEMARLSPQDLNTLVGTAKQMEKTVYEYRDFIAAIFLTPNVPASTANLPSMLRRVVVLSDTDSTMFSVDEWVTWYFGELCFTPEAFGVAGAVMYVTTQAIAHNLAIFSVNMGVKRSKIFDIAMKPEFLFLGFAQTPVAKHYFASKWIKEGNVYKKPQLEKKGVHLKNSALPENITQQAEDRMVKLLEEFTSGKKISLLEELNYLADLERKIEDQIRNVHTEFFERQTIRPIEAYAKGENEPKIVSHRIWKDVFAPKYGQIEEPAYLALVIPTTIKNKTDMANWLNQMEDQELADRFRVWLQKNGKEAIKTFYISVNHILGFGLPPEIISIIDSNRIILKLTNANRLILGSLGYFPKPNWQIQKHGYGTAH